MRGSVGGCQQQVQAESAWGRVTGRAGTGKEAAACEPEEITEGGWGNSAPVPRRLWVSRVPKAQSGQATGQAEGSCGPAIRATEKRVLGASLAC